jgi:cytochrome P450
MLGDSRGATNSDQACLPYGERWRHHRRLTHQVVGTQAVRAYRPFQAAEISIMLQDLLLDPERYVKAIERYSVSVVSFIGFGRRVTAMNDNVAKTALIFMEGVDLVCTKTTCFFSLVWQTN